MLVATCYGVSHQALFSHAFKGEETGIASHLVDLQTADEVTADWVTGQVAGMLTAETTGEPEKIDVLPRVTVVGGGPAGMSAALNLANQGIEVDLIGVGAPLGGHLARLKMPVEGEESPEDILKSYVEAVDASDKIHVYTDTRVTSITGEPGAFQLTGSSSGSEANFSAGAVIVATGAADYEPTEYQGDGRILTQAELEERLAEGHLDCCRVVMIQCVGSRTDDYPVCSQICCAQAVRNALRLKNANPEVEITILHRGIRVFGLDEDLYADAMEAGVTFIEMAPEPRVAAGDKTMKVEFTNASGSGKNLEADLVVLSTGLRPSEGSSNIAADAGLLLEDIGFFKPLNRNLHPVESNRKGIFVCGMATGPKPISECFAEGLAAAGRAAAFLRDNAKSKP
jgi:heterodisulfide reductase subunit A